MTEPSHTEPAMISPVIVVPGITASDLDDEYTLPPEAVWTTVRKRSYERILLHPEDQRYELVEPARVAARGPFPLVYEELIEELRDGLSEDQPSGPVPVYPFGYDWRLPLDRIEERFGAFVDEVVARTRLMKHYRDSEFADNPKVSLIGHSMGGLIIAGYVQRTSGGIVDKVVTLGSPFQGSHEAILKLATGTADLGDDSGNARERRMARTTPSLYHLLPSFDDALDVDDGLPADIFDPEAWQPNVVETIERQVNDWGVSGRELFKQMLDAAAEHRSRTSEMKLAEHGLTETDWLAVAGADAETRVGLRVRAGDEGQPRFDLRSAERRNRWKSDDESVRRETGDGTVPLAGAIPPFLDESRLVCVTPGDFGYWELRDRALTKVSGFHGLLPKMNMLHRLILRFLLEKDDPYENTWGRPLPGVTEWDPPLALRHKGAGG